MTISDETLMAFADNELDDAGRAAVQAAMLDDPEIEKRIARHRALRNEIMTAYAAELTEPVPERLLAAARGSVLAPKSNVASLAVARDAARRKTLHRPSLRVRWQPIAAVAASLIVGVGVGYFVWRDSDLPLTRSAGGALVAGGDLAKALSSQLADDRSSAPAVRLGISFLAKSGDYCRTFTIMGAMSPSGLACRRGPDWQVQVLVQPTGDAGANGPEYRTADSALPPAILSAVEAEIAGEPLDRAAEITARRQGWGRMDR